MKQAYIEKMLAPKSLALIDIANSIISDYRQQGFDLTLRQLYYQMVARDIIENTQRSYKRIGDVINNARLAGLIDWDAIVDRTRFVRRNSHWDNPTSILESASYSYLEDRWADQAYRPEVWIEKDALVGVISSVCSRYDVPFFSCRGYVSQSSMRRAGERFRHIIESGKEPVVIHLADHDPSGMQMSEDNSTRLSLFSTFSVEVERIALNMDQILQYSPPPNPAKLTDSRAKSYIRKYGTDSWELDALEPTAIEDLIKDTLVDLIDWDLWEATQERIDEQKKTLNAIAENYDRIKDLLDE